MFSNVIKKVGFGEQIDIWLAFIDKKMSSNFKQGEKYRTKRIFMALLTFQWQ